MAKKKPPKDETLHDQPKTEDTAHEVPKPPLPSLPKKKKERTEEERKKWAKLLQMPDDASWEDIESTRQDWDNRR